MKTISQLVKLSVLTVGVGSLMVLSAPVAHADCPLLDPECVIETLDDATDGGDNSGPSGGDNSGPSGGDNSGPSDNSGHGGGDLVEDSLGVVIGVVDETLDDAVELVEDTVHVVPGVADETLEGAPKVTDPVEDIIPPDDPPVPVPPGAREVPGVAREAPLREAASSRLTDAQAERSAVVPTRPSLSPPERPGLLERIGEAAGVAARQLSFPLALSLIVVAFVLFQNYLDRKDPKLAVAPIAADVLKFE